jgi:hypothetical protein
VTVTTPSPLAFRILSILFGVLALPGWAFSFLAGDMAIGIPIVLAANCALGAAQAFRFFPIDSWIGKTGSQRIAVPGLVLDFVIAGAIQLVAGYAVAIAAFVARPSDSTVWWMPLMFLLLAVMGAGVGVVGSLIVLVPLASLLALLVTRAGWTRRTSQGVAGSLLLLTIAVFSVTITLAVETVAFSTRSRIVDGFLAMLGLQGETVISVNEPLLWVARGLVIVIVAEAIWLSRTLSRRSVVRGSGVRGVARSSSGRS